jgi:hypothetical protein
MNNLGLKLIRDAARNGEGFAGDPRLLRLSDEEIHARSQGYVSLAEFNADVKARLAAERAELEADAETDELLAGVRDLIGHKAKLNGLYDTRDVITAGIDKLQKHVAAPSATEQGLRAALAQGARRMLASVGLGSAEPEPENTVDTEQLAKRLEAEQRAALVAREALQEANAQLTAVNRKIAAVESRREPFLADAKQQVAEPLGPLFLKQLAALRETYSLLCAYHSGWTGWESVAFPRPRLDTTNPVIPDKAFKLSVDPDHRKFWRDAEQMLLANPSAKIRLPLNQ